MRILVAFDGSPAAARAALFVTRFAAPLQAEVVLLGLTPRSQVATRDEQLTVVTDEMAELGVQPTVRLVTGDARPRLADELDRRDYDLLVLDGGHRWPLSRAGTPPAPRVARRQPVPILVAHRTPPEIRRVLVCIGVRTPHGVQAYGLAARIADATGATAEVLHVISQVTLSRDVPVDERRLARGADWHVQHQTAEGRQLAAFVGLFTEHEVPATPKIRYGLVVDEILQEAGRWLPDLVVLGAHEAGGMRSLLLDDLAGRLLAELQQPVLVVRSRPAAAG